VELRRREVENLVIDSAFWRGRRVFLTGHTGFKGAWLALALKRLNARTTGYALAPPSDPSLFDLAHVARDIHDVRGDVTDLASLSDAMRAAAPEIVIHMAAQSLVRAAYADPVEAYNTNVMGSVKVLEAARTTPGVRAVVLVTTDKCYDNRDWLWAYRENDPLGGRDPYSSSKACAELVARCYRDSFFSAPGAARIVTARAGNVIGGGDFAVDRIAPDAVRAFIAGRPLRMRNPSAVRPWQHVMEPLAGYLLLAEAAAKGALPQGENAFNFGPGAASERCVEELAARFVAAWGDGARWTRDDGPHPHEAPTLRLDASKAREILGWRPLLDFDETTDWTAQWYRAFAAGADLREATLRQVDAYLGQRVKLTSPFSETEADAGAEALRASA
jgi:CDP-glucose 4,6-dehydratase